MSSFRKAPRLRVLGLLVLPAVILAYLCLPRGVLALLQPGSELGFSSGFLHLNLHYAAALTGAALLAGWASPGTARWALPLWLHGTVLLRGVEAGLLSQVGIGFSPLFFHHLEPQAVRLAVSWFWPHLLALTGIGAAVHVLLGRMVPRVRLAAGWERAAALVVIVLAANSGRILWQERRRLPQGDFASVSLAANAADYWGSARNTPLEASPGELAVLRDWGIDLERPGPRLRGGTAARPLPNLVLVYLEGFQLDLTAVGGSALPGLTPHLDRFAARFTHGAAFYNAVTPTINALIASQCGILAQIENRRLFRDRGYARNLACLGDLLHEAGYRQVFLGGASKGFSGKELFLRAHRYAEVWGWEDWRRESPEPAAYHEWGLHDTELVRRALARLPALAEREPFHLTLLTLNTHPPGYLAPDCPVYRKGERMLNAIHCTDHAIGMLLEGLEAAGLAGRTVVVLVGDHVLFPTPAARAALGDWVDLAWFGKTYLAVRAPGKSLPPVIERPGYTPDLAPTVLDLLGLEIEGRFPFGRSLLAEGPERPRLIAPRFEVRAGKMTPARPELTGRCPPDALAAERLRENGRALSECARARIARLAQDWQLRQRKGAGLTR